VSLANRAEHGLDEPAVPAAADNHQVSDRQYRLVRAYTAARLYNHAPSQIAGSSTAWSLSARVANGGRGAW